MYCEYFGLSKKPCQLSPDVAFFFPSSEHRRALAFLEYGVDQADGFIVVTGAVGTGKSMLVQALLRDIDETHIRVATVVTSHLGKDDLVFWVAAAFGLDVRGVTKAVVLKEFEQFLVDEAQAGRRVLLIVDEVQNLPPDAVEELRMLSNFVRDGRPLIQVFLVGQEEFRDILLSPGFEQLRQRVIATYHLNPLSETETRTYIEYRLSLADWARDPDFSADAFSAIYRYTDGVPRRINSLCDRLLLFAYLEELHRLDASHVRTVAEEISSEFRPPSVSSSGPAPQASAGAEPRPASDEAVVRDREVVQGATEPLETMARVMFDKANVQQRLAALERGVDGLGRSLKVELAEVKDELVYVRGLVEDLMTELRFRNGGTASQTDNVPRLKNQ